jgi:dipeptidyl aminopeptidase/acylaminoacyl peptidase
VDAVTRLPGIDAARIGIWGVSLGGYYAARVASGDERVRAAISLCPVYCLGDIWDRLPDLSRAAFTARSKSQSAEQARQRAAELTMAGRAGQISAPILIVAGKRDRIFPWQDADRLAAEIGPRAELLLLEDGNHGCANVVYRHRPYGADWMAGRLAG